MKTVTLVCGKELLAGENIFYSEYDMLVGAINFAPNGVDIAETFSRQRLIKSLEPAAFMSMNKRKEEELNDTLLEQTADVSFEDADYVKMQALLRGMKWHKPMQALIDLAQKFEIKS